MNKKGPPVEVLPPSNKADAPRQKEENAGSRTVAGSVFAAGCIAVSALYILNPTATAATVLLAGLFGGVGAFHITLYRSIFRRRDGFSGLIMGSNLGKKSLTVGNIYV